MYTQVLLELTDYFSSSAGLSTIEYIVRSPFRLCKWWKSNKKLTKVKCVLSGNRVMETDCYNEVI